MGIRAIAAEELETLGVEIDIPLDLSAEKKTLTEMHSILNIMTILCGELELLAMRLGEGERLAPSLRWAERMHHVLADREAALNYFTRIEADARAVCANVAQTAGHLESEREGIENVFSIFEILKVRCGELAQRRAVDEEGDWLPHPIEGLMKDMGEVFGVIEKNSKERYRIVNNIARQTPRDYLVEIKIESPCQTEIEMPPVMQDVMRDLMANARKYTPPGGSIRAGLVDEGEMLRLVVEDNGCGIPAEQIPAVVAWGVRGRNAIDVQTKGGGFGLTKAYMVARRFGGRMWIRSQVGIGTRITIVVPKQQGPAGWG